MNSKSPLAPDRPAILLVDDDPHVLEFLAQVLRRDDWVVYEASSAEAATRVFQEHLKEIGILITDLVMPDVKGDQLTLRLLELKPGLKFMIISGNPLAALKPVLPLIEGLNFLQKPFNMSVLRSMLAKFSPRT